MTISNQDRAAAESLNRPYEQHQHGRAWVNRPKTYTITVRANGRSDVVARRLGAEEAFARAEKLAGENAEWFSRGEREGKIMGYEGDAATTFLAAE